MHQLAKSSLYKRPISVLVVVYTGGGEVLLLQRCTPRDFWQSITGSLEANETLMQAARREVFEETGITAEADLQACGVERQYEILPAWRHRYASSDTINTEHWFTLRVAQPFAVRLNPVEHIAYQWLPAADAAHCVTSATNKQAILEYVRPRGDRRGKCIP